MIVPIEYVISFSTGVHRGGAAPLSLWLSLMENTKGAKKLTNVHMPYHPPEYCLSVPIALRDVNSHSLD